MPGFTTFVEHAPGESVTNENLPVRFSSIKKRTGIEARNIAGPKDTIEAMSVAVGQKLFDALGINGGDCGGLVLSSSAYVKEELINVAGRVAHCLNIQNGKVSAINFACSGFPAATKIALSYCRDAGRPIVLITAEMLSRFVDFSRQDIAILLGDRASATTVDPDGRNEILEVSAEDFEDTLDLIKLQEVQGALNERGEPENRKCIIMDGPKLYRTAPQKMYNLVVGSMSRLDIEKSLLSTVIQHQANGKFAQKLEKLFTRGGWDSVQVVNEIAYMGNVGSSSIPCALTRVQKLFKGGEIVACPAVGAGADWKTGRLTKGIVVFRAACPESE